MIETRGTLPDAARVSDLHPAGPAGPNGHSGDGRVAQGEQPRAGEPAARERDAPRPVISVVAPVWNEAPALPLFYERMVAVLDGLGEPWELILVDDGSTDASRRIMRELHARDPRVKMLSFSRNFAHQVAITAGLDYAAGDAVVVIDSDLQDPPEVIPELVARWREGYGVVYAVRAARAGETWFKKLTASVCYRLIRRIANVDIPVDTGDFRLFDRRAAVA